MEKGTRGSRRRFCETSITSMLNLQLGIDRALLGKSMRAVISQGPSLYLSFKTNAGTFLPMLQCHLVILHIDSDGIAATIAGENLARWVADRT